MFVFVDKPFSKLKVAEQKEFAAVFRDEICTQPSGLQFCVSTLTAIIEIEINRLASKTSATASANASLTIHKIGLMARLVVCDDAVALWQGLEASPEESERPQFLNQTNGVQHPKNQTLAQLLSVADTIKDRPFDDTIFDAEKVGAEAANALSTINPSLASFKSGEEILDLKTKYVNMHDQLIQFVDCSGSAPAEGTLQRRLIAWQSFNIAGQAGTPNVGLFYCFAVWEGKNCRWLSRRLTAGGRSSANGDNSTTGVIINL